MNELPISVIVPAVSLFALTAVPAILGQVLVRKADAARLPDVPEREYRTAWWSYILLLACMLVGGIFLGLGLRAQAPFWRWGGIIFGGFFLVFGVIDLWAESRSSIRIDGDSLYISEVLERKRIRLADIVSVNVVSCLFFIKTAEGTNTLYCSFQRPWELLAILRHVARQNALRHGKSDEQPPSENS